ncbi:MAG: hypothetical protein O3B74_05570 [Proteobacteria bacterium]|nr:hypothetical protein [Pseudomonadota bacterium]
MALPPTNTGAPSETRAELIRRISRPASRPTPSTAPLIDQTPSRVDEQSPLPQPGFLLRTATTEAEIEAQLTRLRSLIANDNIDPNAPVGSYLNILL